MSRWRGVHDDGGMHVWRPSRLLVALLALPAIGIADDTPGAEARRLSGQLGACIGTCRGGPDRLACLCRCMHFHASTLRPAETQEGCRTVEDACRAACGPTTSRDAR